MHSRVLLILILSGSFSLGACSLTGPECLEVEGRYDHRDPAYAIDLDPGIPIRSTAEELAKKHGFTVSRFREEEFLSHKGFSVDRLPEAAFDGLRCEPVVQRIWHNGRTKAGW